MQAHPSTSRTDQEEAAFLAQYDASGFPHPSVTVDLVLMTIMAGTLHALVLERAQHPHKGQWALPGGFVGQSESLEDAALRVLETKVRLRNITVEQLYTFGKPDRDPRTRVLTVAYFALVPAEVLATALTTSTSEQIQLCKLHIAWSGEKGGPIEARSSANKGVTLAFDHAEILGMAVKRLRGRVNYTPIAYQLLAHEFTLRSLQQVHEAILGKKLNKDSFRRRMLASGQLQPTGRLEPSVDHRPAELYRCRPRVLKSASSSA